MLKFRFSTSQTRWVTRSESVQFIHFIISNSVCFLSLPLFLSTKHQVELLLGANRLNLIRLHSAQTAKEAFRDHPPDFSFKQRKTITFKFPDKKITGSKTVEAFGWERMLKLQSLTPPASLFVATFLATNLLVLRICIGNHMISSAIWNK